MLAPVATLVFLTVLWISAVVMAEMFGHFSSRILAAIRGETRAAGTVLLVRTPPRRADYARRRPLRARPQLRAAA